MGTRKPKLDGKNGEFINSDVRPTIIEKSVNNWDAETERARQELAYYERLEAKIIQQLVKESNAILASVRVRTTKLCQLDRQYLRAKLTLMISKLEASEMCEQQIMKIKVAHREQTGIQL